MLNFIGRTVALLFGRKPILLATKELTIEPEIPVVEERKPRILGNGETPMREKPKNPPVPQMKFPFRPSIGCEVYYPRTTKKFLGPGKATVLEISHNNGNSTVLLRRGHPHDMTVFLRRMRDLTVTSSLGETRGDRSRL